MLKCCVEALEEVPDDEEVVEEVEEEEDDEEEANGVSGKRMLMADAKVLMGRICEWSEPHKAQQVLAGGKEWQKGGE